MFSRSIFKNGFKYSNVARILNLNSNQKLISTKMFLVKSQSYCNYLERANAFNTQNLIKLQNRSFARASRKLTEKSKDLLQQVAEKKSLEDELEQYTFEIDALDIKKLEQI